MSMKPIFVATHPRACSTAFERVFMTRRNELQTIHEPFGDAFYYGPERMSARFENDEAARQASGFADSTFKTVFDRIEREAAEGKRVFIKDITHYLVPPHGQEAHIAPSLERVKRGVGTDDEPPQKDGSGVHTVHSARDSGILIDEAAGAQSPRSRPPFPYDTPGEPGNPTVVPRAILEKFHFTFLIRHPKHAAPSYYRCCIPPIVEKTGFEPYMPSEAGYDELRRVFDYCKDTGLIGPKVCGRDDATGRPAVDNTGAATNGSPIEICVIDADDLLDDPEGILRKYCQSIGIDFRREMLNWDSDEDHEFARQAFEKWNGFHDDAINSRDLKPRAHKHKPKTDEEMYNDWVEKYGRDAADIIKKTVDENVAAYEHMKQYAIQA